MQIHSEIRLVIERGMFLECVYFECEGINLDCGRIFRPDPAVLFLRHVELWLSAGVNSRLGQEGEGRGGEGRGGDLRRSVHKN